MAIQGSQAVLFGCDAKSRRHIDQVGERVGFHLSHHVAAMRLHRNLRDELYPAPRSWTERAFPKLIHFNKLDKGGHFAAWEQPKLFSEELRAGFRSLR
jgi:pimeloyl-ACP methyl ester carboxylesterase